MLIHNTKKIPAQVYRSKDGKKYLPARLMYDGKICSGYETISETSEEIVLKGDYNDALIDFQIEGRGSIGSEKISMFEGTLFLDDNPLSASLPKLCGIGDLHDSISVKDKHITFEQNLGGNHAQLLDYTESFLGTSIGHVNNFTNWEITETGFKQTKKNDNNSYFRQPVYDITNLVEPNTTYFFYRNLSKNFSISNSTTDAHVGSILLYSESTRLATAYRWEKFLIFTTPENFESLHIHTYTVPANSVIKEYADGIDYKEFCLEWTDVGLYPIGKANVPYLGTMTNNGKTDANGAVALINQGEKIAYPLKNPIITDLTNTETGQALLEINTEHGKDKILSAPNGKLTATQYIHTL